MASSPSPSDTPPTTSATPTPSQSPPPAASPPPPADSSPPPPPPSTPPPESAPSPPPPEQSSPSPPPPKSSSPSPSPPKNSDTSPPPPTSNEDGDSSSPPPPPAATTAAPSWSPPAPPQSAVAPASSNSSSSSKKSPSSSGGSSASPPGGGGSNDSLVIIVGVAAGAALLLFVMTLLFLACDRRKKKQPPPDNSSFYGGPSPASKVGAEYYYYGKPDQNNWVKATPDHHPYNLHHVIKIQATPPPPHLQPPLTSATPQTSSSPPVALPSGSSGEVVSSAALGAVSSTPHRTMVGTPGPTLGMSKSSFTYEELAAATGNFAESNILGQGGFGYVFKGVLPDGTEVAVKTLKPGSGQGDREFQAEVEIITRVHHRYLVSLVGYCIAASQRMLVYEFVPNSTLEYHLHGKDRPVMDWPTRLKIALGSAKGLAYLHEDCHPRIIHRDIKASNILLEHNFEAKVADFGLAKLTSDNNTHVSTRVMGTFGYLAPEYAASGKLTEKSDTFSFGVMLLELITGRRPVDPSNDVMEDSLVDWARPLIDHALTSGDYRQLLDPRLEGNYAPQELASMVACAGACTRHSARRRPKMGQVVRALEGDLSLDVLNSWNKGGGDQGADSSSSAEEYGGVGSSYSADLRNFRKIALGQGYTSSEYGVTSEYGLNPSCSSSDEVDPQEEQLPTTKKP